MKNFYYVNPETVKKKAIPYIGRVSLTFFFGLRGFRVVPLVKIVHIEEYF